MRIMSAKLHRLPTLCLIAALVAGCQGPPIRLEPSAAQAEREALIRRESRALVYLIRPSQFAGRDPLYVYAGSEDRLSYLGPIYGREAFGIGVLPGLNWVCIAKEVVDAARQPVPYLGCAKPRTRSGDIMYVEVVIEHHRDGFSYEMVGLRRLDALRSLQDPQITIRWH